MEKLDNLEVKFEGATEELKFARHNFSHAVDSVIIRRHELEKARKQAFMAGKIDGKNEQAREMQYDEFCGPEIELLRKAEANERQMRMNFEQAQTDLDLLRYKLRIIEADLISYHQEPAEE